MKLSINQKVVGALAASVVLPIAAVALVDTNAIGFWIPSATAMFAFCVYMSHDLVPILFEIMDNKGRAA